MLLRSKSDPIKLQFCYNSLPHIISWPWILNSLNGCFQKPRWAAAFVGGHLTGIWHQLDKVPSMVHVSSPIFRTNEKIQQQCIAEGMRQLRMFWALVPRPSRPQGFPEASWPTNCQGNKHQNSQDSNQASAVLKGLPSELAKASSSVFTTSSKRDLENKWLRMCTQLGKIT